MQTVGAACGGNIPRAGRSAAVAVGNHSHGSTSRYSCMSQSETVAQ